jgi:hypothetical protein
LQTERSRPAAVIPEFLTKSDEPGSEEGTALCDAREPFSLRNEPLQSFSLRGCCLGTASPGRGQCGDEIDGIVGVHTWAERQKVDRSHVRPAGFDARVFELYLFAYFSRSGYAIDFTYNRPDFIVERNGVRVAVEATTSSRPDPFVIEELLEPSTEEIARKQRDELPFAHDVGQRPTMETWGEGIEVYHNPNALIPLPRTFFRYASDSILTEAKTITSVVPDFHPFTSHTISIDNSSMPESVEVDGVRVDLISAREFNDLKPITEEEAERLELFAACASGGLIRAGATSRRCCTTSPTTPSWP